MGKSKKGRNSSPLTNGHSTSPKLGGAKAAEAAAPEPKPSPTASSSPLPPMMDEAPMIGSIIEPSKPTSLRVSVTDPERHGSKSRLSDAFINFKITTEGGPSGGSHFVRRRYRDFVWLRKQLCEHFPGAIVPPLPVVDSLLTDDRFSADFVQRRQAGLELFLRRVVRHDELSTSTDLQMFLEAKVWELQTAKNQTAPSWYSMLFDGPEASLQRVRTSLTRKAPDGAPLERLRAFTNSYTSVVSAAAASHHAGVAALAGIAADLGQLGPAIGMLSQSESELSLPFTAMATELDALRELCERQVQLEHVSGLASLLAFNSGMAASLKEVLANRDAALLGYETAGAALESRQAERVRVEEAAGKQPEAPPPRRTGVLGLWDDLTAVDSEAGAKAAAAEEEARAAVAAAKERHLKISDRIHVEAEAFHTSTNEDFAAGARQRMALAPLFISTLRLTPRTPTTHPRRHPRAHRGAARL